MSSAPGIALEYRIYRNADAEPVTALLADVFPRHDPLALAAGVSSGDFAAFVRTLLPQADHDGLTIVACVPATGEIVGVMLTHDAAAYVPLELSDLSEKFEPIAGILGKLDAIGHAGREPQPGETLHLYLLGVSDRVARHGVGQQLVERTAENGLRRGYQIASAEATNSISQHIFRKCGFSERAQLSYRDYPFAGRPVFAELCRARRTDPDGKGARNLEALTPLRRRRTNLGQHRCLFLRVRLAIRGSHQLPRQQRDQRQDQRVRHRDRHHAVLKSVLRAQAEEPRSENISHPRRKRIERHHDHHQRPLQPRRTGADRNVNGGRIRHAAQQPDHHRHQQSLASGMNESHRYKLRHPDQHRPPQQFPRRESCAQIPVEQHRGQKRRIHHS